MDYCYLICDMQFGSTGKGLLAGHLAMKHKPDTLVTNWMPNAGHTYIDDDGRKFVHTMLANGVVSPRLKRIMIAPGSALNLDSLMREIESCKDLLKGVDIIIHENAAVVTSECVKAESQSMTAIGSTKKGCGVALANKLQRNPENIVTVGQLFDAWDNGMPDDPGSVPFFDRHINNWNSYTDPVILIATTKFWLKELDDSMVVQIEGAQGFSLGINSGFYPYCTSRECTPAQICSDCLIGPDQVDKIIGCMRTYPIRVANRFDENGNQVGYSGPGYRDQEEISWKEIGVEPELTTVTKLPRRVFTFSEEQTEMAMKVVRPHEIFVNFANYVNEEKLNDIIRMINKHSPRPLPVVKYIGYGPRRSNVSQIVYGD